MKQFLAGLICLLLYTLSLVGQQLPVKGSPQSPSGTAPAPADNTQPSPATPSSNEAPQTSPAQAPTPPDYSQEAYVVESFRQSVRFENDGTGKEQTDARIRIVSESGVQALGQLKVGYSALSDKLEIEYVRVHKPDGTIVEAQESAVQDLTIPDAPVYTDYHQKHISVPSLRPGDMLEYRFVRNIVHPLAPGQFWTSFNFAEQGIVLDEELEIDTPKGRQVKLKAKPGFEAKVSDEGDRRIYRWTHSHLKDEEEKRGKERKKRSHDEDEVPSVELTTFQSWKELGAWYASLERDRRLPDTAVKAKADQLVAGKTEDIDKVKALYDYVSHNFRYVSLSFGLGRYQPHAAAEVLANGYGDCKDKNTLLASLLQAESFQATSVLIGSQHRLDPDIPSPSQFDHVITLASEKGKDVWLDSTSGVAPFRMLAAPLRDKQALAVPQSGNAYLVRTPTGLPFEAYDRTSLAGSINETGKFTAHVAMSVRGDSEMSMRYALRQVPSNKWKDIFEYMLRRSGMRNAEITNLKASDPSDANDPLQVDFDLAESNYFDWSAPESAIPLPLNVIALPGVDDEDSSASPKPIKLGDVRETQASVRLTVPAKYSVRMPIGIDVKRDYAEYRSVYKYDVGQLMGERSLKVLTPEVPYARLADYQAFRRAVEADGAQQVSLENKSPGTAGVAANESADDLNEAGLQALKNEHYDLAVALFQRVLKLDPKHKTAWESLGLAYLNLNDNDKASDAFKRQIELNAYDQFAYNYLGLVFERQQKYDLAIQQFQKQIEINPLDPRAHASLGSLYSTQKNYVDAVPELEKATDIEPRNPVLQVSLGQAYIATGQTEKGMAAFEKAISLAPTPLIWNNIAYSLAEENVQLERADRYIDAAINGVETQLRDVKLDNLRLQDLGAANLLFSMWDTKGWIAFKRGDIEAAEQWIMPAWLASARGDEAEHLGEIYRKRGKRDQAARYYVLSLAAENPSPEARAKLTDMGAAQDLDRKIQDGRRELQRDRAIALNHPDAGTADFFLLVSPAKVEDVRFIKGDGGLKGLSSVLEKTDVGMTFPPASQVHVPRRGSVVCGATPASPAGAANSKEQGPAHAAGTTPASGACTLELVPSDSVRGLD